MPAQLSSWSAGLALLVKQRFDCQCPAKTRLCGDGSEVGDGGAASPHHPDLPTRGKQQPPCPRDSTSRLRETRNTTTDSMAPVSFWTTPFKYIEWAARVKPAIFWSIVVGSMGPLTVVCPGHTAVLGAKYTERLTWVRRLSYLRSDIDSATDREHKYHLHIRVSPRHATKLLDQDTEGERPQLEGANRALLMMHDSTERTATNTTRLRRLSFTLPMRAVPVVRVLQGT